MDDEILHPGFDDNYVESLIHGFDLAAASDLWNNEMNGSFDNLKITEGTPAEMTRHEPAPAVSSNLAADNVMPSKGAPAAGPVAPSVPQHTPATHDCSTPSQHKPLPLYWTNPSLEVLISGQGHASSSSWAQPAPPQTELLMQVGAVAPRAPDMAALQPQRATDASCPGSSTGGRERRARNASNASNTRKVRKPKEWQRTTPYDNEEQERRRQRAIKARNDRENKKDETKRMKDYVDRLVEENQSLKGIIQQLEKELRKAKQ